MSTSSLKRGFRPPHPFKISYWPESHKANDYIGHILVSLWLHHTEPPGTTIQSGLLVTLATNQISHFSPVWLLWLMTQFALTLHTVCNCVRGMGKDSGKDQLSGTMPPENYPFRKQIDNLSDAFLFLYLELILTSTLRLRNKRPCLKKLFPQITTFPEEKPFSNSSLQCFPAHDAWVFLISSFGWQYGANLLYPKWWNQK